MLKRIRLEAVGHFSDDGKDVSESVYEKPVMMVYAGKFDSMDGPVEITDDHIHLLAANHNSFFSKLKHLATGGVAMKDCPPLQLDHSASARDTIGRLVGELKADHVEIDGEKKLALFGTARFLGKENIEKAKDGRYTHVSIGADLEDGKINELSVTPFPAAPKASLLSKKRMASYKDWEYEIEEVEPGEFCIYIVENGVRKKVGVHAGTPDEVDAEAKRYIDHERGEIGMHDKLKKHLMEHKKLSEQDAEKLAAEITEHQKAKMGKDDNQMSAHLAVADDKELSRMSDDHDADKKLAAEKEAQEKLAAEKGEESEDKKLARKNNFLKMAKGLKSDAVKLAIDMRKSSITARLARLRSEGKMTPAEIKKFDVAKLAAMSNEAVEASLATLDVLEKRIRFGAMAGSSKAEAVEKITKKYRLAKLELETRLNMPSKKAEAMAKLSKLMEDEKKELAEIGGGPEEDPSKGMLAKCSYADLEKMLSEGRHEELKAHLKRLTEEQEHEQMSAEDDKHMSSLAKKHAELQTNLEQLVSLASHAFGISSVEL